MRDTVYNMITEYVENITDRFASPEAAAVRLGCKRSGAELA